MGESVLEKLHRLDPDGKWVLLKGSEEDKQEEGELEEGEFYVREFLRHLGLDVNSDGLLDTPRRVVASWKERTSGYNEDPAKILSVTFDVSCDEMILLKNIPFFSTCEHHLLPFSGIAHVGYIPDVEFGRVVGISKLARLVDCFAKRLQIQERMSSQIADAMVEYVRPEGVGVVVEASHLCMVCRGVMKHGATMKTTALRGVMRTDLATRAEFLGGINERL